MTLLASKPLNNPTTNPRLVLVKAKGGMGNRLLCAVSGVLYAKLTQRDVLIDWTDATYSDDRSNVFNDYFSKPVVGQIDSPGDVADSVYPPVWQGHLDQSMSEMLHRFDPDKHSSLRIGRKYSVSPADIDRDEDVLVIWSYSDRVWPMRHHLRKLDGSARTKSVQQTLREALADHFELHPAIQKRVDEYRDANWKGPMIGLHLRCTDRMSNVPRSLRHVRRLLKEYPEAGLFVATDNRETLAMVQREFPRAITTEKWYPDDGAAMHQNDSCPSRFENGVEALIDMKLLSDCDFLVYPSRSTFSFVSALWSDARPENLIDVDRFEPKVRLKHWIRRRFE